MYAGHRTLITGQGARIAAEGAFAPGGADCFALRDTPAARVSAQDILQLEMQ